MAFETVVESESSKKPTFPHEWFFLHSGLFVCCPMMTTLTWMWRHNTFCAVAPAFHGPRNGQLPFSGRGPLQLAPHSTDSFGWPFFSVFLPSSFPFTPPPPPPSPPPPPPPIPRVFYLLPYLAKLSILLYTATFSPALRTSWRPSVQPGARLL